MNVTHKEGYHQNGFNGFLVTMLVPMTTRDLCYTPRVYGNDIVDQQLLPARYSELHVWHHIRLRIRCT